MAKLLHDARFWTAVVDALTGIVMFVAANYMPLYGDLLKVVWLSMQGIFVVMIGDLTIQANTVAKLQATIQSQRAEIDAWVKWPRHG